MGHEHGRETGPQSIPALRAWALGRAAAAVFGSGVRRLRIADSRAAGGTPVRMAYDGRNLEIMVTGPVHDHFSDIISQFIHVVARAGRIPRVALGETTWIRPEIHRGLEADRCYMFDPAKIATTNALLQRATTTSRAIPTLTWPSRSTSRVLRWTGRVSTRRCRYLRSGRSTARS